jgi:hypothetical protein
MSWRTVERPGYFGRKREELYEAWNKKYGDDNWRIAYRWGDAIIPKEMAIQIYEDAYFEFLKKNPAVVEWLISSASDIYDTAPSNVEAGFDYSHQETPRSHIHDIAIRRVIARLGKKFRGNHLVEVRWKESEGFRLNPGRVPFHMPDFIIPGEIKDYGNSGIWWEEKSIEDFYQRNKVLQVKEE